MKRIAHAGVAVVAAGLLLAVPAVAQAAPATPTPAASATPAPAAATPSHTANYGVSVTTPTGDYSPVRLTITGLQYGERVAITGAPEGWAAENWYDRNVSQHATGPLVVEIEAPLGWPEDHAFVWKVTFPEGSVRQTSFTYRGAGGPPGTPAPTAEPTAKPTKKPTAKPTKKPTTKPTKKPVKDRRGGLAKTGF